MIFGCTLIKLTKCLSTSCMPECVPILCRVCVFSYTNPGWVLAVPSKIPPSLPLEFLKMSPCLTHIDRAFAFHKHPLDAKTHTVLTLLNLEAVVLLLFWFKSLFYFTVSSISQKHVLFLFLFCYSSGFSSAHATVHQKTQVYIIISSLIIQTQIQIIYD